MDLRKNTEIPLSVTGVTGEGNGIGRSENGMAVFVPYTAVGDEIVCRIQKVDKRFAFGRMTTLVTPSHDRTDERVCGVYEKCGGCVWRHVTYEAEARYKWQKVADAVRHIGGLSITPAPIVGAEDADRYRNKAQYPLAVQDGRVVAGFYAPRSHRVIPCTDCALQPAFFADILRIVIDWAEKNGVSVYDETAKKGLLRHVYIRHGEKTGEVMVCLVATSGKLPALPQLTETLQETVPALRSLVVNINRKDTNVILGDEEFTVFGEGYITDILCGLRFKLSPRSFFQVNPAQTEKLYTLAREALELTGEETLLDLYCGTGTIGLSMAGKVKTLIGVEIVAPAVEDAKQNAADNGITNARFMCADAAAAAKQLEKEGVRPDAVVIDPPRKGCDEALLDTIATMAPQKLVYVSCDPATLARDLKRLAERGYQTMSVTPVDLFPGTMHCETVALLSRQKVDEHIYFDVNVQDLPKTARTTATYPEIKAYVKDKYGLNVTSLNIAQVKEKHGFEKRQNYNKGKDGHRVPNCPPEKEKAIEDAFKHFGML